MPPQPWASLLGLEWRGSSAQALLWIVAARGSRRDGLWTTGTWGGLRTLGAQWGLCTLWAPQSVWSTGAPFGLFQPALGPLTLGSSGMGDPVSPQSIFPTLHRAASHQNKLHLCPLQRTSVLTIEVIFQTSGFKIKDWNLAVQTLCLQPGSFTRLFFGKV